MTRTTQAATHCALILVLTTATAADPPSWDAKVREHRGVFLVEGHADLPDRTFLYVRASYRGTVFGRVKATVHHGAFKASLGPFDSKLWRGEYTVGLRLLPGRQRPEIRAQKLSPLRGERVVRVGSEELEAREERLAREHYVQILKRVRAHLRDLLNAFCRASRTLPGFAGAKGESDWHDWLVVWHLLSQDHAESEAQLKRWSEPSEFEKEGKLEVGPWRAWVDGFRKALKQTRADQRRTLALHVAPKHPRAALDLELVFDLLNRLSLRYSAALYRGQRLSVHRHDERSEVKLPNQIRGAAIDHIRQLLASVSKTVD